MAQVTPWQLFSKSFNNKATAAEVAEIDSWLDEDPDNVKLLDEVYDVYSITNIPDPMAPNVKDAWNKIDRKIKKQDPLLVRFRKPIYLSAIAAIIVFGLLITGWINLYLKNQHLSTQYTEITTQPGQRTSVVLPDGSTVWLNSSTKLKYPSAFNLKEREVFLSGEAFFKVQKNKKKGFRVRGKGLDVRVYGTSFNVKNYNDEIDQQVTVEEGIVGVIKESKEVGRLTRNQQITFNKNTKLYSLEKVDPELYTSWRNNILIFRDTPIEKVVTSLESWYGVGIKVDEEMLGAHNYTFKIKTESLKEVLDMMQVMTPFSYTINGNEVLIKYKK